MRCALSVVDITRDSGSRDGGSIPSERVIFKLVDSPLKLSFFFDFLAKRLLLLVYHISSSCKPLGLHFSDISPKKTPPSDRKGNFFSPLSFVFQFFQLNFSIFNNG